MHTIDRFKRPSVRAKDARAKGPLKIVHDSGQVYTETESSPAAKVTNGPAWLHESPFLLMGWEEGSPFGASPLRYLAMRTLVTDQRNLSIPLFANVPWHIARDIWDYLGRCHKQTLHMWKIFATVYPIQFREIEQYRSMKIEEPRISMREYLGLTKSKSLSWRVVLTLGSSYARIPELVGISEIKNLVALDIATPPKQGASPESDIQMTALTDRIVRTWSEMAQTKDAFSQLRVMIIRNQTDLSKMALHFLKSFPSLQFVVALECPGIASAFSDGGLYDGWMVAEVMQSPPGTLYELYKSNCKAAGIEDSTPVLEFQIGKMSPKPRGRANRPKPHCAVYQRTDDAPRRMDPEPSTRKRKDVGASDSQRGQAHPRKGKAVMKDRTKDIGDVLSGFF